MTYSLSVAIGWQLISAICRCMSMYFVCIRKNSHSYIYPIGRWTNGVTWNWRLISSYHSKFTQRIMGLAETITYWRIGSKYPRKDAEGTMVWKLSVIISVQFFQGILSAKKHENWSLCLVPILDSQSWWPETQAEDCQAEPGCDHWERGIGGSHPRMRHPCPGYHKIWEQNWFPTLFLTPSPPCPASPYSAALDFVG